VAPESARAGAAANRDDAATAAARPPEIDARRRENQRPARDGLDDAIARHAEQREAVQTADEGHERQIAEVALREVAEHDARVRVDEDVALLAARQRDIDARAAARIRRRQIAERRAALARRRRHDARRRQRGLARRSDRNEIPGNERRHLVLEEIEAARHGEQDEERQRQQAGVEVPAPDRRVDRSILSHSLLRQRSASDTPKYTERGSPG